MPKRYFEFKNAKSHYFLTGNLRVELPILKKIKKI